MYVGVVWAILEVLCEGRLSEKLDDQKSNTPNLFGNVVGKIDKS